MFNLKWEFVRSSNWQKLIQLISALQTLWSSRFSVSLFNCLICCFQRISPYFLIWKWPKCVGECFFSCSSSFLLALFHLFFRPHLKFIEIIQRFCQMLFRSFANTSKKCQYKCIVNAARFQCFTFFFILWFDFEWTSKM